MPGDHLRNRCRHPICDTVAAVKLDYINALHQRASRAAVLVGIVRLGRWVASAMVSGAWSVSGACCQTVG